MLNEYPHEEAVERYDSAAGLMRKTSKGAPVSVTSDRLEKDGYLFVKGLLPREDVLCMREQ